MNPCDCSLTAIAELEESGGWYQVCNERDDRLAICTWLVNANRPTEKTQPKTTTEVSTRGSDILKKTRNSFKHNTGDHIIERVKRANNKTINEAKQMQVRIRRGKQGKYALTHINYDITHGHLEVWTQSANTADTNSDSRDDKARKAKEDT